MRGRYTRVLFDGLPLAGQQVGGLGLLQIPPMDLGQVEVIKGVASALYGAGAMGGVINLVARRPQDRSGPRVPLQSINRRHDRRRRVLLGLAVAADRRIAARRRPSSNEERHR